MIEDPNDVSALAMGAQQPQDLSNLSISKIVPTTSTVPGTQAKAVSAPLTTQPNKNILNPNTIGLIAQPLNEAIPCQMPGCTLPSVVQCSWLYKTKTAFYSGC